MARARAPRLTDILGGDPGAMAQLVARLVRNEKVGGSNPPSSTDQRHRWDSTKVLRKRLGSGVTPAPKGRAQACSNPVSGEEK